MNTAIIVFLCFTDDRVRKIRCKSERWREEGAARCGETLHALVRSISVLDS